MTIYYETDVYEEFMTTSDIDIMYTCPTLKNIIVRTD